MILKSCPCCGAQPKMQTKQQLLMRNTDAVLIECPACGLRTADFNYSPWAAMGGAKTEAKTHDEAAAICAAAWNSRV